jgi:hypothetical protein
MQADVVYGGNYTVHIGNADYFVPVGEFFGLTLGRQFGLGGKPYEWHMSGTWHLAIGI